MLTSTFIHAPGIGYSTERRIWDAGALTWDHFLTEYSELRISPGKKALLQPFVEESVVRLEEKDYAYFADVLPKKDHWRALSEFGETVGYLDIETTGCDWGDCITVIGIYDGFEMKQFIQGINMDEFPAEIARYQTLVTFFGSGFDIPFIRRTYPDLKIDQLHVDLCHLLRRIGLTGGLKKIETHLGVRRIPETEGLDGFDAVRLWSEYRRGSQEALELLLLYNREDVINMEMLLRHGCSELLKGLDHPLYRTAVLRPPGLEQARSCAAPPLPGRKPGR